MWKSIFSQLRYDKSIVSITSDYLRFSGKVRIALDDYVNLVVRTTDGKVELRVDYTSIVAIDASDNSYVIVKVAREDKGNN